MQDVTTLVGGGGGAVSTASAPLSINAGDISIDMTGIASEAALANKLDTLTAIAPIAVSGSGTERYISSLWKPSAVSVGPGLFTLSSDNLGTLSLALTGTEDRSALKLRDASGSIKSLTNNAGTLQFDGADVGALAGVTQTGVGTAFAATFFQGREFHIDSFNAGTGGATQAELRFKYDATNGTNIFSNQPILGILPGPAQAVRFYNNQSLVCLEIPVGSQSVSMPGSLSVSGTKNFEIVHPSPSLEAEPGKRWRLRHSCIESDKPYLMYRLAVDMTSSTQTVEMPESWFPHIATDVCVHLSPFKHFGSGWGELEEDGHTITLHTTTLGQWHVLLTAVRNDAVGQASVQTPIEFQEPIPTDYAPPPQ